jgi:Ca2+:H+ antiporter
MAVLVLGLATVVTAFVTETLVGSLEAFARQAHLSEFFVAAVIVAIVGAIVVRVVLEALSPDDRRR